MRETNIKVESQQAEAPPVLSMYQELGTGFSEEQADTLMRRLREVEIVARRQVEDVFAGEYHTAFKGSGMVFSDYRPYQPGDEVRWIDWNVSARADEIYVKQFVEERERTVMLLWDVSSSMHWGTRGRRKSDACLELAMLFALSAVRNQDRVGLILFSDRIERSIPPRKGRKHIMRMLYEVLQWRPAPGPRRSDLGMVLRWLHHTTPRHTIAIILSDFLVDTDTSILSMVSHQHELLAFVLRDPVESHLLAQTTTTHENSVVSYAAARPVPEREPGEEAQASWTGERVVWALLLLWAVLCVGVGVSWGGWWLVSALAVCGGLGFGWWLGRKEGSRGLLPLFELETGEVQWIDRHNVAFGAQYAAEAEQQLQACVWALQGAQIEHLVLHTHEDVWKPLRRFFRRRQRRR